MITDTDTALIAPAPARSAPSGSGLACLRSWRRARDRGAPDDAREAALIGPSAPTLPINPLDKEQ